MDAYQQRKLNKYQAESAFMTDSAADFTAGSPGGIAAAAFAVVIALILSFAGEQSSNVARQNIGIKDDLIQDLKRLLRKINRAANAMAEEIDGIEDLFRMPRRRSEEIWLATARAFFKDSEPFESDFRNYDLPGSFRTDLMALIDAIEATRTAADIAGEQKGGATGGLVAELRNAGKISRRLNAIVRNKYDGNAQKLAAWSIASHLEAAPKRKEEPTP